MKPFATNFFSPGSKRIFVFGSNKQGYHGAGAAKWAVDHAGAIMGQPCGGQGQSYGICTKDWQLQPLSLDHIKWGVQGLIAEARKRPELAFYMTPIGCGYSRHSPDSIKPFFWDPLFPVPDNIILPKEFK